MNRGFERSGQDYYIAHDRLKQLWERELVPQARQPAPGSCAGCGSCAAGCPSGASSRAAITRGVVSVAPNSAGYK